MNLISESIQNNIFLAKDAAYNDELYKLCFGCLQRGRMVLLLTLTPDRYDMLPLARELNFSKALLKRFIIMYFSNVEGLTRKLLELSTLQPELVIVDFGQPRPVESVDESANPPPLQSLCLCIASLFSFMESLRRRRAQSKAGRKEAAAACQTLVSLVVLPAQNAHFVSVAQVELLINLYFYKNNAFDDFGEFKAKLFADN